MGTVEDIRKVLQEFLAPELRAMTAQIEAMSQIMDARFESMSISTNSRFDSLSNEIAQIKELLDVDRRLAKLESKQAQLTQ
jgi:capsule polysaccharide export protein KpsE/RkpR